MLSRNRKTIPSVSCSPILQELPENKKSQNSFTSLNDQTFSLPPEQRTRAKRFGRLLSSPFFHPIRKGITDIDLPHPRSENALILSLIEKNTCPKDSLSCLPINSIDPKNKCFSEEMNEFLLQCTQLTYSDQNGIKEKMEEWGFSNVKLIAHPEIDSRAIVAYHPGLDTIVCAVRGSKTLMNFAADCMLTLSLTGTTSRRMAHSGFFQYMQSFKNELFDVVQSMQNKKTQATPLMFTGHSLGGAVATMLSSFFLSQGFDVKQLYTWGEPRSVNRALSKKIGDQFEHAQLVYSRICHEHDPIAYGPKHVQHVRTPYQFFFNDLDIQNQSYYRMNATKVQRVPDILRHGAIQFIKGNIQEFIEPHTIEKAYSQAARHCHAPKYMTRSTTLWEHQETLSLSQQSTQESNWVYNDLFLSLMELSPEDIKELKRDDILSELKILAVKLESNLPSDILREGKFSVPQHALEKSVPVEELLKQPNVAHVLMENLSLKPNGIPPHKEDQNLCRFFSPGLNTPEPLASERTQYYANVLGYPMAHLHNGSLLDHPKGLLELAPIPLPGILLNLSPYTVPQKSVDWVKAVLLVAGIMKETKLADSFERFLEGILKHDPPNNHIHAVFYSDSTISAQIALQNFKKKEIIRRLQTYPLFSRSRYFQKIEKEVEDLLNKYVLLELHGNACQSLPNGPKYVIWTDENDPLTKRFGVHEGKPDPHNEHAVYVNYLGPFSKEGFNAHNLPANGIHMVKAILDENGCRNSRQLYERKKEGNEIHKPRAGTVQGDKTKLWSFESHKNRISP